MCYSAEVVQSIRKLHRELGIRLDYHGAELLLARRIEDPTLNISRGFKANFEEPTDEPGRRIKALIDEHRNRAATKAEKELFTQKTRLVNAERSLQTKETKKAREDVRIATDKIEKLTVKLKYLRRVELKSRDNRSFPMVYAGVIMRQDGENLLSPMRYFCRPAGKRAVFDKKFPGLYNARRDNLEKFWSNQFGQHHALMVVDRVYENGALHVKEHRALAEGEQEQNVVLRFTPQPSQAMLIACLWSPWTGSSGPAVRGFAAITDEPPPDVVAAGHDRCSINLLPHHVDAWLTPNGRSTAELQSILSDRAVRSFDHELLKAA